MPFTNRSLSRRGSRRKVRAIKAGDHWSRQMTLLVIILVSVVLLFTYLVLMNPPRH